MSEKGQWAARIQSCNTRSPRLLSGFFSIRISTSGRYGSLDFPFESCRKMGRSSSKQSPLLELPHRKAEGTSCRHRSFYPLRVAGIARTSLIKGCNALRRQGTPKRYLERLGWIRDPFVDINFRWGFNGYFLQLKLMLPDFAVLAFPTEGNCAQKKSYLQISPIPTFPLTHETLMDPKAGQKHQTRKKGFHLPFA